MRLIATRIFIVLGWLILVCVASLLTTVLLGFAQFALLMLGALLCLALILSVILVPRVWLRELRTALPTWQAQWREDRGFRIALVIMAGVIAFVLNGLVHDAFGWPLLIRLPWWSPK